MTENSEQDELETLDLLYGKPETPDNPQIAERRAKRAARPRDRGYDLAYEHRRMADPVLRQRYETRQETERLIHAGKLHREPCEVCGDPKTDAHHPDYRIPDYIIWLCRPCHNRHHGKQRRKRRTVPRRH